MATNDGTGDSTVHLHSDEAKRRIIRDLKDFTAKSPPGIFVEADEDDLTKMHALIKGPLRTPYDGGFFYFTLQFPPNYPRSPPRVKFLTTDDGKVTFSPNLYADGTVCISMLGTWEGPQWTPAHSLTTVLETIQSLMNKDPYYNEPVVFQTDQGVVQVSRNQLAEQQLKEQGKSSNNCERYNSFVRHETLRVAVCQMLENPPKGMPDSLRTTMKEIFLQKFAFYLRKADENIDLDGKAMLVDAYDKEEGTFRFRKVKEKLLTIHSEMSQQSI